MQRYWPILILRLALAMIFGYFGYLALSDPASQLGYISPTVIDLSPLSADTMLTLVGVAEIAVALAFLVGFWVDIAGYGAALLLLGIVVSLIEISGWPNEIAMRDIGLLAGCLVLANAQHLMAIQPSARRTIGWQFLLYAAIMIVFAIYIITTKL